MMVISMSEEWQQERAGDMPSVVVNVTVELQPFGKLESSEVVYFDREHERGENFPRVLEPMTLVNRLVIEPAIHALPDYTR